MSGRRKNLVGEKFGLLSVLQDTRIPPGVSTVKRVKNRYVQCRCDCGKTTAVRVDHLRSGKTRSCGCLSQELRFTDKLASVSRAAGGDAAHPEAHKATLLAASATMEAEAPKTYASIPDAPRASQTEQRHGLPAGEYQRMLTVQGGLCAICLQPPGLKPLCVDHCHATGIIRGLLCSACNQGIGFLRDDVLSLGRAIVYLTNNK